MLKPQLPNGALQAAESAAGEWHLEFGASFDFEFFALNFFATGSLALARSSGRESARASFWEVPRKP